jgi:hypothetical protein
VLIRSRMRISHLSRLAETQSSTMPTYFWKRRRRAARYPTGPDHRLQIAAAMLRQPHVALDQFHYSGARLSRS